MKWQVAMWLVLGLLVAVPVIVAEEPKPAEVAESEPGEAEKKHDAAAPIDPMLQPPGELPAPRPTSQASGLIYIQPGTGRSEQSSIPLNALLRSQEVQKAAIEEAAKKHLGQVPEDMKRFEFGTTQLGTTTVTSFDDRLRADWVLDSLREQVAKELVSLDNPVEQQAMRDNVRKHTEQLTAEWYTKRRQLADLAKRHHLDADAEVAKQRRLQLALDTQRLTVELQSLNARQIVLTRQLAELLARPNDENATKIIEELGKVIYAKKRHVEALLNAKEKGVPGTVSKFDIDRANGAVAEAEIELAKFRREASTGGNLRATELRHRLDDTLIEIAEAETKLVELTKLDQPLAQIDDLRMEVDLMEHEFRRARQDLDEIEAKLRGYIPPRVVLIRTK